MTKIKKESCPCYNCICVPVCRNKEFLELLQDCSLITDYANNTPVLINSKTDLNGHGMTLDYNLLIQYRVMIQEVLQPITWRVDVCGFFIDDDDLALDYIYDHIMDEVKKTRGDI